ncbi:MAG: hypothetical protein B1H08_00080 [Candidatus Omnitrophica bacterium 4484_171]|nr:MAG: hypothetical protein B1H08_00080 [Candidatus Omnitrophica bacterium 4484_171]
MRKLLLFLGLIVFSLSASAQGLGYYKVYIPKEGMSADEIMRIMYNNKYSLFAHDYQQTGKVFYIDKSGFTRKRIWKRMRITKAGENGISYKDIVAFTYPTELKGLAVLTWTYVDPKREQDEWLWLPSLKKVRKISASQNDDAFLGSDFTVEEVSTRRFEDETYKLLGEKGFVGYTLQQTGEVKFKGKPCFVVECRPVRSHWYYSKRVVWVDKETGGEIFEEYYDKTDKLFKTLFREWAWTAAGGKKYVTQLSLECKDLRTGHRTTILMKDTKYDQGISEQNFTVKALMRSRW